MSVLYPEENELLGGDTALGSAADKAKGVLEFAKEQIAQKWGIGGGSSSGDINPEDVAKFILEHNRDAVLKLQDQYAKHNTAFSLQENMTPDHLLDLVIAKDKDKIAAIAIQLKKENKGSLIDAVQIDLKNRLDYSTQHEDGIFHERQTLRDGINFSSKTRGLLDWQWTSNVIPGEYNYSDSTLRTLTDQDNQDLVNKFKETYADQIRSAAGYIDTSKDSDAAYREVVSVVKDVIDHHKSGGSRGDDFFKAVNGELQQHSQDAANKIQQAKNKLATDAGINLSDENQREALRHAMVMMGHGTNLALDPKNEAEYRQYSDMLVKTFLDDDPDHPNPLKGFRAEVQANGGANVLAAIRDVWNARNGENQGAIKMSPEQFHEAVDAQLVIKSSGIDLNDPGQRKALAHALSSQHSGTPQNFADVIGGSSLTEQGKAVYAFENDFFYELDTLKKKGGGNEKTVLDAVNRIYANQEAGGTKLITDPKLFHQVLQQELGIPLQEQIQTQGQGQGQGQPQMQGQLVPNNPIDLNDEGQRASLAKAMMALHPMQVKALGLSTDTSDPNAVKAAANALNGFGADDKEKLKELFKKDFASEIQTAKGNAAQVLFAVGAVKGSYSNENEFHALVSQELNRELTAAATPVKTETGTGQPGGGAAGPNSPSPGANDTIALPPVHEKNDNVRMMQLILANNGQLKNFSKWHMDGQLGDLTTQDDQAGKFHFIKGDRLDVAAIRKEYATEFGTRDMKEVENALRARPDQSKPLVIGSETTTSTASQEPKNLRELEAFLANESSQYLDQGNNAQSHLTAVKSGTATANDAELKKLQEIAKIAGDIAKYETNLMTQAAQDPKLNIHTEMEKLAAFKQHEIDVGKQHLASPNSSTPQLVNTANVQR